MSPVSATPPPASLRKVLCSLATGPHAALLDIARPSFEAYAERHGYDLVLSTTAPAEAAGRPAAWGKIPFLREQLHAYDVVLWLDADVVIVDGEPDIATQLDDDRFLHLVTHHFGRIANPNTGVMVWRACPEAHELLDRTWAEDATTDHPWWEQAAMLRVLGYEVDPHPTCRLARPDRLLSGVSFLPTTWNSIAQDPAPHPRFEHFAGVPHADRLADMADAAARARGGVPAGEAVEASVVLMPFTAEAAWQDFLRLAELPEEPAHEVVVVHLGVPGLDELLARLGGSVRVVRPAPGTTLGGAAVAGVSAARADTVILLSGASQIDQSFVARRIDALARPTWRPSRLYPTASVRPSRRRRRSGCCARQRIAGAPPV
jgi:hypothetical protein